MKLDSPYISYILDVITDIENSVGTLSKNKFEKNKDAVDANIRRIIIINEVIKNISQNLKNKYPETDWKKFEEINELLKHQYFGIDTGAVWDLLTKDIPLLKERLKIIKTTLERGK